MADTSNTASDGHEPTIFISYQRDSSAIASELHVRLESEGFTVWQDVEGIRHSDRWSVAIDHALRQAERIIVLLTPQSMQSEEVFNEWFYFYRQHKPIHCLLLENCEPHYQLLPFQYLDWREAPRRDWGRLIVELQRPFAWPTLALKARVVGSPYAPQRTLPQAMQALHDALLSQDGVVALRDEQVQQIALQRPGDEMAYRLARYATWCGPRYQLDERFVRLTLMLDQGSAAQQRFAVQGAPRRYSDLRQVLAEEPSHTLVLLGDPGAGKSTLLRRLEMDCVADTLRQPDNGATVRSNVITLSVSLAEYGLGLSYDKLPAPLDWLSQKWSSACPALPALDELLHQRRMLLLLDSLNEMPHSDAADYRRRADLWRAFLYTCVRDRPGNRAIFACRTLDYGAVLSTDEYPIPQVRLEPMTREQVREYLDSYAPEHAEAIWTSFDDDPRQFELFRLPYWLKMLVERVQRDGHIPSGRAEALSGFVHALLAREVQRRNPLFENSMLLTEREVRRLREGRPPRDPYDLPEVGQLIPSLSGLAYGMQAQRSGEDKGLVLIDCQDALALLSGDGGETILSAGCAMNVLEETDDDRVRYYHQLLQEFFAARRVARIAEPGLVRAAWQAGRAGPDLQEALRQIADSDPLPLLPGTGWEETTVLAAAMARQPEPFLRGLIEANLPLAGRCAAAPDVMAPDALRDEIRWALARRTQDPEADLRARIAAGLALGDLGDPRFQRRHGPHGDYLLPPLAPIPGGSYPIGSDEGLYANEAPAHSVSLEPFQIGQFAVTNAEYALFMAGGGYEEERWWDDTEAGRAWRRGGGTAEGPKQQWRESRDVLQEWLKTDHISELLKQERITSKQASDWEQIAKMDHDEFERLLEGWYPAGRQTQPSLWDDSAYNNPAQPVVGVCWHEARAYCAWLAAQTGQPFRLPTEAEWEAAARGQEGRRYPYGPDFDAALGNTFESHIRRPTPIGVYPGGQTPEGLADMSGNTWDWTSSAYLAYPYRADPQREDPALPDVRRVVRGGSWDIVRDLARCAYRDWVLPGRWDYDVGFRVVCAAPPITL